MILRRDAKAAGLKRYFTGVACKNGHTGERRVSDGMCLACGAMWQAKARENPEFKASANEKTKAINRARYRSDTNYREKKMANERKHAPERAVRRVQQYNSRSDLREAKAAKHIERYANDPAYVSRIRKAKRDTALKRDATRAAALLTETLGVSHVVVETVDPKTGRKDWQPKPAS